MRIQFRLSTCLGLIAVASALLTSIILQDSFAFTRLTFLFVLANFFYSTQNRFSAAVHATLAVAIVIAGETMLAPRFIAQEFRNAYFTVQVPIDPNTGQRPTVAIVEGPRTTTANERRIPISDHAQSLTVKVPAIIICRRTVFGRRIEEHRIIPELKISFRRDTQELDRIEVTTDGLSLHAPSDSPSGDLPTPAVNSGDTRDFASGTCDLNLFAAMCSNC